jgi:N-acetylmuramoyl-L-alanine amidase
MDGVLLDPGHGGDPEEAAEGRGLTYASLSETNKRGLAEECYGAIAASGYMEKDATLAVAQKVGVLLERKGIPVELTRSDDRFLSLEERVARFRESRYRKWILVSLHFNRSSRQQQAIDLAPKYYIPEGFEIYVLRRQGRRSKGTSMKGGANNRMSVANWTLAKAVENELADVPGIVNRKVRMARFVVLRDSPLPAILIEGGFMSNPKEGELIATDEYQWKLAEAITAGLLAYRERCSKALAASLPEKTIFRKNQ